MPRMRHYCALAGMAATLASCAALSPADEYAMPMATAYQKLASVSIAYNENAGPALPFAGHSVRATGDGTDHITWTIGKAAPVPCVISLLALAPDKTKVAISCKQDPDVAQDFANREWRNEAIVLIDATLTGKAYDPRQTAFVSPRWPADTVPHASVADIQNEAVRRMIAAQRAERAGRYGHSSSAPSPDWAPAPTQASTPSGANPWAN